MTKEELREYRPLKQELAELNRLDDLLTRHRSPELQDLYDRKRRSLTARLKKIEQAIDELSPTERRLMRLRYIEGKEWHQVAVCISYSWQQTHRIHAGALQKLKDK